MKNRTGRNDPCLCGSGKKFKKCCMQGQNKIQKNKSSQIQSSLPSFFWEGDDGVHCAIPGIPPTEEQLEKLTEEYQKQIQNSPMWNDIVSKFGKEKAEELLKQCRAKLG